MTRPAIASCEHCKGPAWWTIHHGEVYYICQRKCDGFMQLDFFYPITEIDRSVSMSAAEAEAGAASCMEKWGLPF